MPVPYIKKLADESGLKLSDLEKSWEKAKEIVNTEYKDIPDTDPKYYKLITSIFKTINKENLNESAREVKYVGLKELVNTSGKELIDKEGGIVTLIKNPGKTDIQAILKMNNHDTSFLRGGILKNELYIWPGNVLHDSIEKFITKIFDIKFTLEYIPDSDDISKKVLTLVPSEGAGSDQFFVKRFLIRKNHEEAIKALISAGVENFLFYNLNRDKDESKKRTTPKLSSFLKSEEITEDGEGMISPGASPGPINTTATIFGSDQGKDTRFRPITLDTVARGGSIKKPKVKKPAGYSRMTPSISKILAESFKDK
jgi:hypothetical protein